MTEGVAGRRRGLAHREERGHLQTQRIAHVVEPESVTDLRVNHRHHMAPRAERAGLFGDAALLREFGDQVGRNEFDELPQDRSVAVARLLGFFFFSPLPSGR